MLRNSLQVFCIVSLLSGGIVFAQDSATPAAGSGQAASGSGQAPSAATTAASGSDQAAGSGQAASSGSGQPAGSGQAAGAGQQQPSAAAAAQAGATGGAAPVAASSEALPPKPGIWPFSGMNGYVDKQAAQRGFQIYSQVCSACHSMNLLAYRDLSKLGFSEAEIKAIAAQKQVSDMNDSGEPIQRPGKPFDNFVPPFANEKASRAANNGAYPPDLSLIIKAREEGPDYVYSILTGFATAPATETPVANKYYNPYFQGHWISMPPPLHDGAVTYQDGTNASVDQMARDVVTFLQWAAEPEMQDRHEMGIKVLIYLAIMTVLFYLAKKRTWKKLK